MKNHFIWTNMRMTIVRNDLDECVEQIHNTIQCEHAAAFRNRDFIKNISEDLKQFAERRIIMLTSILQ